jgi:lysophospholipid acyltransferase (LPLAT)-like uncharacterized protein
VRAFYKTPWFRAALAWTAAQYLRVALGTQSWRVLGEENLHILTTDAPVIGVFWHETLPSMPVMWPRARRLGMRRPAVVLASQHRDGQLIGQIMKYHGVGLVSGSSSRGGAAALRTMLHLLANGSNVAITPDGPRGPARHAAPGVLQLAALSGARILPCAAYTSRAKTLNSWDSMRLPLPFGRGALAIGAPITVPRDNWQAELPALDATLNALLAQAEAAL